MTKLYFPLICFKFIFALNCCFRESDLRCNTKPSSLLFFFFFFQHRRRRLFGPSARLTVPKASFGSIIREGGRGGRFGAKPEIEGGIPKKLVLGGRETKKTLLLTTWSELKGVFLFFFFFLRKPSFSRIVFGLIHACGGREWRRAKKRNSRRKKKISTIKKKKMRDSSVCGQKFEELDVPRPGDRAVI